MSFALASLSHYRKSTLQDSIIIVGGLLAQQDTFTNESDFVAMICILICVQFVDL